MRHEAFACYLRGELRAVRSGRWKLHLPHAYGSIHGASPDIGETTNVAELHADVVARLLELAERARADLGDSLTGRRGAGIRRRTD
jgi:hypothetical protein